MRLSILHAAKQICAGRLPSRVPVGALAAVMLLAPMLASRPSAQNDLDQFMQQVLATRDTNWRKLQQYILDEREQVDMRGPSGTPLWGERRDYTWYVRDGFFVRSPLKVNGAAVSEADRRKYEETFLDRERKRDARGPAPNAPAVPEPGPAGSAGTVDETPRDVDGVIRQSRQPQFISSAYFLRFTFDAGRYALVGRESLDGRDVLRIEYYPEQLFKAPRERTGNDQQDDARRRRLERMSPAERRQDEELRRLMNKTSKVTLWVEPSAHQIVKYTFDDLGWNFFPGQWLAQIDGATATMTMGQPFPDVWLPKALEVNLRMVVAFGSVDLRYHLQYDNYRQPDVQSHITVPDRP